MMVVWEITTINVNTNDLFELNLTPDNNGRITSKTETIEGTSLNNIYAYDKSGRLLTVTKDATLVEEYRYDLKGTRNYEMNSLRGITGRTFTYSDEDHLLTAGNNTYQYDLDGFLTSKTIDTDTTNYTYSSCGELLNVTLPDSRFIEYIHDPTGRRIAKKIDGTITEKYLWAGLTTLLATYDGSDNLITRFEYADGRMPVSMTKQGVKYYLAYDQVGSLRLVADNAGNIVKQIDYDSFGNIINDTNSTFTTPFGFAGGLHDIDTGLVRFGYRDYDTDTGRWTAKDPIGFAGGDSDLYGYVLNDPVNFTDPEGLWVAQAVGAAFGGGVNAYKNYHAYKSGKMSGTNYAKSIAFGAGAGVLASFGGPGLGALLSGLNNVHDQVLQGSPCIDWKGAGKDSLSSLVTGGLGSNLGNTLKAVNPGLINAIGTDIMTESMGIVMGL